MSSSGQDAEEAAELMATCKAEHVPMKSWYNNPAHQNNLAELKGKHGDFPLFWQDLIKWSGWKEVRREYLRFTEGGGFSSNGGGGEDDNGKKRRSRWNEEDPNQQSGQPAATDTNSAAPGQPPRKRKSRWGRGRDDTPKPSINAVVPAAVPTNDPVLAALGLSSLPTSLPSSQAQGGLPNLPGVTSSLTPKQQEELSSLQQRLRLANNRLDNLESEAARIDALPRGHPDRSPSPPPVYDAYGTRKNTRANRWREKYTEERHNCLERIMDLCPSMRPAGFVKRKRSRKIKIPVEDHPTYNFIGLIIGPRGKTQKDMEAKTGCKIAIRGKGSVKEGAKGRLRNGVAQLEGDNEPLHVVITGDDPAAIDAAAEMIESMLVVIDDEKNVHKQNQLRELALLNGTLKEEEWCHLCGEKGHRNFECPKRFALNNRNAIQIKCAICGDTSHPTRDCTMKSKGGVGVGGANNGEGGGGDQVEKERQLDSDYSAFMAELEGKPVPVAGEGGENGAPAAASAAGDLAAPDTGSVLTIIQPARVVKVGETNENSAAVQAPVDPATGVTTISAVTTISSTVPNANGVTTISSSVPGVTTISSTAPVADPPASGVTTISSTALPPAPTTLPPPPPGAPPASLTTAAPGVQPPLPAGYPPVPGAPAPSADANATAGGVPPPPPPPASSLPPPPPPAAPGAYPGYNAYGAQQGQWAGHYQAGYQQQQAYGQQQQQWGAAGYGTGAYGQGNDETAGWDPNSYYGAGGGGAGGFNWWESSS